LFLWSVGSFVCIFLSVTSTNTNSSSVSLIQQVQKFLVDIKSPSDTRTVRTMSYSIVIKLFRV
jgi:hypothetical protein